MTDDNNRPAERTPQYNAHICDLIISFAENLIREGRLDEAQHALSHWAPINREQPSTLERIASRARDITLGKVLRYQGNFSASLRLLEPLATSSLGDEFFEGTDWHRVLVSNLSDVYSELGRGYKAQLMLEQELQPMYKRDLHDMTATGRRLQLSLAEAYMAQALYAQAAEKLVHLKWYYKKASRNYGMDVSLFRVLVSLGRVYHRWSRWEKAEEAWEAALLLAKEIGLDEGYNRGLLRYPIAHAVFMKGETAQANGKKTEKGLRMKEEAQREMMGQTERMFWITGFNERWEKYISRAFEQQRNLASDSPADDPREEFDISSPQYAWTSLNCLVTCMHYFPALHLRSASEARRCRLRSRVPGGTQQRQPSYYRRCIG